MQACQAGFFQGHASLAKMTNSGTRFHLFLLSVISCAFQVVPSRQLHQLLFHLPTYGDPRLRFHTQTTKLPTAISISAARRLKRLSTALGFACPRFLGPLAPTLFFDEAFPQHSNPDVPNITPSKSIPSYEYGIDKGNEGNFTMVSPCSHMWPSPGTCAFHRRL